MKFKLDENLPAELLGELRKAGHAADSVDEEGLAGTPDRSLLAAVRAEDRVLLTMDKGIANIRRFPPWQHAGIVLFRPPTTGREMVFEFVRKRLPAILEIELRGRLLVVSQNSLRLR
jgi:predicted nuclease of predicted toxin-antitoxin system